MRSLFDLVPLRVVTYWNPNTQTSLKQYGIVLPAKKQQEADRTENGVKVSLRYVHYIVRTVKGNPGVVLEAANELHQRLQFTIEELDSNVNLAFLDLIVNVNSGKMVTCGLYQKSTDTGTNLNSRGFAPLQYKKTRLKGWFIEFSEVPPHGKNLTRHWKKIGNNGFIINIRKFGRTGWCLKLLTKSLRERKI